MLSVIITAWAARWSNLGFRSPILGPNKAIPLPHRFLLHGYPLWGLGTDKVAHFVAGANLTASSSVNALIIIPARAPLKSQSIMDGLFTARIPLQNLLEKYFPFAQVDGFGGRSD